MDNNFLTKFENNLSISETLYERIMKIIKIKNMTMEDFYSETNLNRNILSDIKENRTRPTLRIVITICIGLGLEPNESYEFIRLAGYNLVSTIYLDYVYIELLNCYYEFGIAECNKRLKELGVHEKYYLGSQTRK